MDNNNYNRIVFRLCCIALIVTSMTFAIRAGILGQLGGDFGLTDTELGWVNAMAFLGFPTRRSSDLFPRCDHARWYNLQRYWC